MNQVKQSPSDRGMAGWVGILADRQPQPALDDSIETDYLIVGAGFAGLAAARRLTQLDPAARIVIVEAHQVAQGPSGRNTGFMIDMPHVLSSNSYAGTVADDLRDIRMNRAAIAFASEMAKQFRLPGEAFDRCGKWNAAASGVGLRHNAAYARHLDNIKEPYRLFSTEQMHSLTGTSYYQGGLWTPGTAMIQPALFIRGIADALTKPGQCLLFEQTPVISLSKHADRWVAKTPNGSIRANKTILAVNGLIENFGFYQRRLMHINLYASMTRELTREEIDLLGGSSKWGFTPADPLGTTLRRISGSGGHRLLIRNRCTYDPRLSTPENRMGQIAAGHDQSFHRRFPMLPQVSMEYRWSGRLCLSRNNVWAVGEVAENLFSACCQNGLGATKGTIAGIVSAEKACESKVDSLVPDYVEQPLPTKLWPEPLMTLGARGYLKFREYRAGREL